MRLDCLDGVLTVPAGAELPEGAFAGREDIREAVFEGAETVLPQECFAQCENLRRVVLPARLAAVPAAAFAGCAALEEISLPETITELGDGAFLDCLSLGNIRFPPRLSRIGGAAFFGSGLREALLPETVEWIGEQAFWGCHALRRVEVPNPAAALGANCFGDTPALAGGFLAPGYGAPPAEDDGILGHGFKPAEYGPDELLCTLLWCTCPERHGEATCRRAEAFIHRCEPLLMDEIFARRSDAALSGLVRRGLLRPENLAGYVRRALSQGSPELAALLLEAGRPGAGGEGEFEL